MWSSFKLPTYKIKIDFTNYFLNFLIFVSVVG